MALTPEQVEDAIRQMIVHCKLSMEQYEAGVGEYETVSARGVLYTLGFEADVDQILQAIADCGFSYCLDSRVEHDGHTPPSHACYWGADQLESRLHGIPWRLEFNAREAKREAE